MACLCLEAVNLNSYLSYFNRDLSAAAPSEGNKSQGNNCLPSLPSCPAATTEQTMPPRCDTCRADGARMRCTKCSELVFCNRECLRRSWHLHKKVCGAPRRWVSVEMAIERMLAKYKPDPPVPKAACYICLEEGDVMRNCACRGDAGYVHLKCLVEHVERNPHKENLHSCPLCNQMYTERLGVGLARMMWQRARDTDHPDRCQAVTSLSWALQRYGELEAVASLRADMPGDSLIDVLSRAEVHMRAGRYHEALECADRAAEDTLPTRHCHAMTIAKVQVKALLLLGQVDRAERVAKNAVEQTALC